VGSTSTSTGFATGLAGQQIINRKNLILPHEFSSICGNSSAAVDHRNFLSD